MDRPGLGTMCRGGGRGAADGGGGRQPAERPAGCFRKTLGTTPRTLGREASRSVLGCVKKGTAERGSGGDAGDGRQ